MSNSPFNYVNPFNIVTANIPAGQLISDEIICNGTPASLFLPANFTTSDITFIARYSNNVAYGSPSNSGVITITTGAYGFTAAVAGMVLPIDPATFYGIPFFKIVCGTAQVGNTNIIVIMGPVIAEQNIS